MSDRCFNFWSCAESKVPILRRIKEDEDQGAGCGIEPNISDFLGICNPNRVSSSLSRGFDSIVLNLDGSIAIEALWQSILRSTGWSDLITALRKSHLDDIQCISEVMATTEDKVKHSVQNMNMLK